MSQQEEFQPLLSSESHAQSAAEDPIPTSSNSTQPLATSPSVGNAPPLLSSASRSKLQARRYLSPETRLKGLDASDAERGEGGYGEIDMGSTGGSGGTAGDETKLSAKARGKRPARDSSANAAAVVGNQRPAEGNGGLEWSDEGKIGTAAATKQRRGRNVTVIFANVGIGDPGKEGEAGNLELWVEDGENVGSVKEQIRHLRPSLSANNLRLIHAGRLLTDGILLLPWLRSLEERVRRQASGMGGDVEEVLKEVGLGEGDADGNVEVGGEGRRGGAEGKGNRREMKKEEVKVFLHCTVGAKIGEVLETKEDEDEPAVPRRRGFDVLLDAGLSPADVANMRRQFYESRGEEVPEGLERGDIDDEHARALEEQWIEGDLTAETATTSSEGNYSSILHGLLMGFLYPFIPIFFFRESPLPNFFDAEAEARGETTPGVSESIANGIGLGDGPASSVLSQRVKIGVVLGLGTNLIFGALRFMNGG